MSKAGRTSLTKVTLSAIPTHVFIAVANSPWLNKANDKIRRGFICTGSDNAPGGRCLAAWCRVTRPVELGVLVLEIIMSWIFLYAMEVSW
jgi:hypothetical protein